MDRTLGISVESELNKFMDPDLEGLKIVKFEEYESMEGFPV